MDTMYRSIARVLAVSAAFFSAQALAQGPAQGATTGPGQAPAADAAQPDRNRIDFDRIDANRDGGIDKQEATAVPGLLAAFDRADANRDGRLSKAELRIAEVQMKRS